MRAGRSDRSRFVAEPASDLLVPEQARHAPLQTIAPSSHIGCGVGLKQLEQP